MSDPNSKTTIAEELIVSSTSMPVNESTSTPASASKNPDASSSVQVLIIFLVAVLGVLILFLFVYFYLVKGSRSEAPSELALRKYTGGHQTTDEAPRNSLAQPEKQLTVNQLARSNPVEPSAATKQTAQHDASAAGHDGQKARTSSSKSGGFLTHQQPMAPVQHDQHQQTTSPSKLTTATRVSAIKSATKSGSGGAARYGSVAGTLANLRDTLREHTIMKS